MTGRASARNRLASASPPRRLLPRRELRAATLRRTGGIPMNRLAIALVASAALFSSSLPAFAAGESKQKITFTDPSGDVTGPEDGPAPLDIVGVELSSDGEAVVVRVTLAAVP